MVLTERMESVHSASVGLWFRQGAAHEPPAEAGISHLLEHLVFKGTARRSPRQLTAEIEGIGGSLDAYTTHEHTAFQARVPEAHLERAVDVLCDLAFEPALRAADLELERRVVLDELARAEETPEDLVFELHAAFLYDGHPYGAPILGSAESVRALEIEGLGRLHRDAYRRPNLVVAAAGRLEHERLVELLNERLPEAVDVPPAHRENGRPSPVPAVGPGGTGLRTVRRPGGKQTHIVAAGLGIPHAHPLRFAAVLVDTALGGGMSSRLFQRIREELGLAYSVYTFHAFFDRGGHLGAYAGTQPADAAAAREALLEELARLAEHGLPEPEIAATREQLRGQLLLALEAPAARMHRLAGFELYDEPYLSLAEVAARIDAIGPGDVQEIAALLHPDRIAALELSPA